jgi:5-methylcytosine-specific restriction endonuclease McrA
MPGDPFYWSAEWRKLRADFIKANPHCAALGCARPTKHVDHRLSRRKRPDLALEASNLRAYCHRCHSRKTVAIDNALGHLARKAVRGCDASGLPRDPAHRWTPQAGSSAAGRPMPDPEGEGQKDRPKDPQPTIGS